MSQEWREQANCKGVKTDLFYPDRHQESTSLVAKEVCAGCVVREECLNFALRNGERHGIWGGMSERQRKKLRRTDPSRRGQRVFDVRLA